jgi:hypothetical protein
MFYKLSPTVKIWVNKQEQQILALIENSEESQLLRSELKQEYLLDINRLVSKSIIWRKSIGGDVLYGKKQK